MPRQSYDFVTIASGESSLRNLAYQPSLQESIDDASEQHSDGESAMSSVLSSVKRTLKEGRGGFSEQSCSTRQSDGMLWQDSESEDELYSTSSEEEMRRKKRYEPRKSSGTKKKGGYRSKNKGRSSKQADLRSVDPTEFSTSACGRLRRENER